MFQFAERFLFVCFLRREEELVDKNVLVIIIFPGGEGRRSFRRLCQGIQAQGDLRQGQINVTPPSPGHVTPFPN